MKFILCALVAIMPMYAQIVDKTPRTLVGQSSLPGSCSQNQITINTSAPSSPQIYVCNSSGAWVLQGGNSSATSSPTVQYTSGSSVTVFPQCSSTVGCPVNQDGTNIGIINFSGTMAPPSGNANVYVFGTDSALCVVQSTATVTPPSGCTYSSAAGGFPEGAVPFAYISTSAGAWVQSSLANYQPAASASKKYVAGDGLLADVTATTTTFKLDRSSLSSGGGGASGGAVGSAPTCNSGANGTIYYPTDSPYALWCNGTAWSYLLGSRTVTPPDTSVFSWYVQQTSATNSVSGGIGTVGQSTITVQPVAGTLVPSIRTASVPWTTGALTVTALIAGAPTPQDSSGHEFGEYGLIIQDSSTGDSYSFASLLFRNYLMTTGINEFAVPAGTPSTTAGVDWSGNFYGGANTPAGNTFHFDLPSTRSWMRIHVTDLSSTTATVTFSLSWDEGLHWTTMATTTANTITGSSGHIGSVGWYAAPGNVTFPYSASLLNWSMVNN